MDESQAPKARKNALHFTFLIMQIVLPGNNRGQSSNRVQSSRSSRTPEESVLHMNR